MSKLTKPNTQIPEGMWRRECSTCESTFIPQILHEVLIRPDDTTQEKILDILLFQLGLVHIVVAFRMATASSSLV